MARATRPAHPRPLAAAVAGHQPSTGSSTAILEEVPMVAGTV